MIWVDQLKESIPEYAKDIKLNLDAIANRSSLDIDFILHLSIAASYAAGDEKTLRFLINASNDEVEKNAALSAAVLMSQNNIWYQYSEAAYDDALNQLGPSLRMNAIANNGGTTKDKFEAYCLISSIIGKCRMCIKSHYNACRENGYKIEQLKDIGRIASVINAISKIIFI